LTVDTCFKSYLEKIKNILGYGYDIYKIVFFIPSTANRQPPPGDMQRIPPNEVQPKPPIK
jgi:hypothetical protein